MKPGQKNVKEQATAIDTAKQKIDREKQADARKHDRMLDRARLVMARKKNRATKPGMEKKNG